MPGPRTSTTATRTTGTTTTSFARAPSADGNAVDHAGPSFTELVAAYFDCRHAKRNTASALAFEVALERNLAALHDELVAGTYRPGPSICFVITRPKVREVWAAAFRDRIVHHLLYNRIERRFTAAFIADSSACIPGRGTLYAVQRVESKVRSVTANWSKPAYYLKLDLANFFVSIDKRLLWELLAARISEPWWRALAHQVLFHDPRVGADLQATRVEIARVPRHKSLLAQDEHHGLPIGNLSSQFFANVLLDVLDQHVKHRLRARHYARYVDDMVLLHESAQWLNDARRAIEAFVVERLALQVNPRKSVLQPVARGVDFAGQVIKPWRRQIRRGVVAAALERVADVDQLDLRATANSYFGLLRQSTASHHDRACLANAVRDRGRSVDRTFTRIAP